MSVFSSDTSSPQAQLIKQQKLERLEKTITPLLQTSFPDKHSEVVVNVHENQICASATESFTSTGAQIFYRLKDKEAFQTTESQQQKLTTPFSPLNSTANILQQQQSAITIYEKLEAEFSSKHFGFMEFVFPYLHLSPFGLRQNIRTLSSSATTELPSNNKLKQVKPNFLKLVKLLDRPQPDTQKILQLQQEFVNASSTSNEAVTKQNVKQALDHSKISEVYEDYFNQQSELFGNKVVMLQFMSSKVKEEEHDYDKLLQLKQGQLFSYSSKIFTTQASTPHELRSLLSYTIFKRVKEDKNWCFSHNNQSKIIVVNVFIDETDGAFSKEVKDYATMIMMDKGAQATLVIDKETALKYFGVSAVPTVILAEPSGRIVLRDSLYNLMYSECAGVNAVMEYLNTLFTSENLGQADLDSLAFTLNLKKQKGVLQTFGMESYPLEMSFPADESSSNGTTTTSSSTSSESNILSTASPKEWKEYSTEQQTAILSRFWKIKGELCPYINVTNETSYIASSIDGYYINKKLIMLGETTAAFAPVVKAMYQYIKQFVSDVEFNVIWMSDEAYNEMEKEKNKEQCVIC